MHGNLLKKLLIRNAKEKKIIIKNFKMPGRYLVFCSFLYDVAGKKIGYSKKEWLQNSFKYPSNSV